MNEKVKLIYGKENHEKIFRQFFMGGRSFIRLKQGGIEAKYNGFHDGMAEFYFPLVKGRPENCSISTRVKNVLITAHLIFRKMKGDSLYCFEPMNIEIIPDPRNDERRYCDCTPGEIIFATNVISDPGIKKILTWERDKLRKIIDMISLDNMERFDFFRIVFAGSLPDDPRMKYFYKFRSPIHISNFRKKHFSENDSTLRFYRDTILAHDFQIRDKDYIVSEISVPVLCNSRIPYGYIQANSSSSLSRISLQSLKRLAMLVDKMRIENKIAFNVDHRFLVSDISRNGVGIAFKNRNLLPYYCREKMVSMDMIFPQRRKASIIADVKHIDILSNKVIKVGFLIREMDKLSKIHFQRALESRMIA